MLNYVAILVVWGERGRFWYAEKCFFYLRSDWRHSEPTLRRQVKWGRSDLKLGKFWYSDFLDCTDCAEINNLGARLSERVFVYNNLLSPGTGYTPQQLVFGISSGIPGIFQIPKNPGALFARSLQRVISGIHYATKVHHKLVPNLFFYFFWFWPTKKLLRFPFFTYFYISLGIETKMAKIFKKLQKS